MCVCVLEELQIKVLDIKNALVNFHRNNFPLYYSVKPSNCRYASIFFLLLNYQFKLVIILKAIILVFVYLFLLELYFVYSFSFSLCLFKEYRHHSLFKTSALLIPEDPGIKKRLPLTHIQWGNTVVVAIKPYSDGHG